MITLSSAAAKRRAARRSRHARSRARRLAQTNAVPSSGPQSPERRKLRDQESLNLEDCFFQCEERGYHLDPDVHIGREVAHSGTSLRFHAPLPPLYPYSDTIFSQVILNPRSRYPRLLCKSIKHFFRVHLLPSRAWSSLLPTLDLRALSKFGSWP